MIFVFFFFQAEDGIRDLVRSRGLGDVYKRQKIRYMAYADGDLAINDGRAGDFAWNNPPKVDDPKSYDKLKLCLLYTSDAADERSSVDLGGRRIIKKKKKEEHE